MKKNGRKCINNRISEIIFVDPITCEIFSYPLDENGCHIKTMKRAKRTNYKQANKDNHSSESTPISNNPQTEESAIVSDIRVNKNKQIFHDIDLVDPLQYNQSIDEIPSVQFTLDSEDLPSLHEANHFHLIDIDLTFDKLDVLNTDSPDDINVMKLF